jgi:DNA replication protein DnaC
LLNSGIGKTFLGTWDSAIGNRQLANSIRQNADKHLFVVGEYGAGKSRAACVNLERIIKAGKRGKYYKFNELARQYAKSLASDDKSPERLFAAVLRHDVIIVDDLCKKEQVSKSAAEFCYEFLDYIYEHDVKCRVWFTSNITPAKLHTKFESQDLASAVASRIDRLHNAGQLVLIKAEDLGK